MLNDLFEIFRPMNIKNGPLAGQSPAFCRPINVHRPAANEHFRPMNIKNGQLAGQSPAFCRPIIVHRPAANEHFKCSLV